MKIEYITATNDYDMDLKQQVFALLFKEKAATGICVEKVDVEYSQLRPSGNLMMWQSMKQMMNEEEA